MNWSNLFLSCSGRVQRRTFLIGLLPLLVAALLLYLYLRFAAAGLPWALNLLAIGLVSLILLYCLACLSAKRLADYGRPAWFIAIFYSPLLVVAVFLFQQKFIPLGNHEVSVPLYTLAIMLALVGFLWVLVEMLFRRSLPAAEGE